MSYKPPKYLFFYLLIITFGITLTYFSYTQLNERDLGIYNVSNSSDTKLNLDIRRNKTWFTKTSFFDCK